MPCKPYPGPVWGESSRFQGRPRYRLHLLPPELPVRGSSPFESEHGRLKGGKDTVVSTLFLPGHLGMSLRVRHWLPQSLPAVHAPWPCPQPA